MYTNPNNYGEISWEEEDQFKKNFKLKPSRFLHVEASLEKRCKKFGLTYIPPTLSDSVETTLERKAKLNKTIAAENKRRQRANLTQEQKESRKLEDMMRQRAALANESPEKKSARKEKNKNSKRRSQEKESPEKRAARNEAKRIASRREREEESPEKREAQNKEKRIIERCKRKNETKNELEKRQKKNRKSQRACRKRKKESREKKVLDQASQRETKEHKQKLRDRMQKQATRADESLEKKNYRKERDKSAKKRAREKESPEKKASRKEKNRIAMRRARDQESLEKRTARKEKYRMTQSRKRKLETNEEREKRRKQNLESQHKHRAGWGKSKSMMEVKEKLEYKEISSSLLEAVGINYKDVKRRACIYKSSSGLESRIGDHIYVENGEDMGIKGWTTGYQEYKGRMTTCTQRKVKTAICDLGDFRSDYEIDPHILKQLNFSYAEICAIAEDVPIEWMTKQIENGIAPTQVLRRTKKHALSNPIPIFYHLICCLVKTKDSHDPDMIRRNTTIWLWISSLIIRMKVFVVGTQTAKTRFVLMIICLMVFLKQLQQAKALIAIRSMKTGVKITGQ